MNGIDRRRVALTAGLSAIFWSLGVPLRASGEQKFPDVVDVKVTPRDGDTFDFDVTIASPYDTASRYADGFRVETMDGRVLGERKLWHDHADEQPFTRDLYGVTIAPAITSVVVRGRDQKYGWGGKTLDVRLPGR